MGLRFINKTGVLSGTQIEDEYGDWVGVQNFTIKGAYGSDFLEATVDLCEATVEMYVSEDNISIGNIDDLNKQLRAMGYAIVRRQPDENKPTGKDCGGKHD